MPFLNVSRKEKKTKQKTCKVTVFLSCGHWQVNRCSPAAHILACAPLNSSCDLLCERLLKHIDSHQVYRMYASSRDPKSIPTILLVSIGQRFRTLAVCHDVSELIWSATAFLKNLIWSELFAQAKLCNCWLAFQKCCNWDEKHDSFVFPDREILMKYRVVVTTLFTAGR